jgi:ribose transport system permease protein
VPTNTSELVTEPTVRPGRRSLSLSRVGRGLGAEIQVLVVFALLIAFFMLVYPNSFATVSNLSNMSRQFSILLVVTIAQAFALLVGGFDLSVGANMAFASTVSAVAMVDYQLSVPISVAIGLAAGAVIGCVNGILIGALGVSPFIATLGTLTFLGGYANVLAHGASISGLPDSFVSAWGGGSWGVLPSSVGLGLIALVAGWVVLSRSRLGLHIYALGGSREASRLAGVRVVWVEIAAYTACGLLAALAGIMLSARVGIGQASLGDGYELLSIAAAVMGGVAIGGGSGRLLGVFLGGALFTVLSTGLNIASINQFVQEMITGCVLVAAVLLARSRGTTLTFLTPFRKNPRRLP